LMNAEQISKRFGSLPIATLGAGDAPILEANRHYRFYTTKAVTLPDITLELDGAKITITQMSGSCTVNFHDTEEDRVCVIDASSNPTDGGSVTITFTAIYGTDGHLTTWYSKVESSQVDTVETIYASGTCLLTQDSYIRNTTPIMGPNHGKVWCSKSTIVPQITWSEFFAALVFSSNIKRTVVSSIGYHINGDAYTDDSKRTYTFQLNFSIDWVSRLLIGNWGYNAGADWDIVLGGYVNSSIGYVLAEDTYVDNPGFDGTHVFTINYGTLKIDGVTPTAPRLYINYATRVMSRFPILKGVNFYNIAITNYSATYNTGNFLTL
jgi:hypothetical protein